MGEHHHGDRADSPQRRGGGLRADVAVDDVERREEVREDGVREYLAGSEAHLSVQVLSVLVEHHGRGRGAVCEDFHDSAARRD